MTHCFGSVCKASKPLWATATPDTLKPAMTTTKTGIHTRLRQLVDASTLHLPIDHAVCVAIVRRLEPLGKSVSHTMRHQPQITAGCMRYNGGQESETYGNHSVDRTVVLELRAWAVPGLGRLQKRGRARLRCG